MLKRIGIWQVIALQLAVAAISTLCLAGFIHFPDVSRRPSPPPTKLMFALLVGLPLVLATLAAMSVRRSRADTAVVAVFSLLLWFLGYYGLMFVWINTYGT